jgi:hypothetical protein
MAYYKEKYEADGGQRADQQGQGRSYPRSNQGGKRQDRSGQGGSRGDRQGRDDRQRQGGQNRRPGNGPASPSQKQPRPEASRGQGPAAKLPTTAKQTSAASRQGAENSGKKGILSRIFGIFKKE